MKRFLTVFFTVLVILSVALIYILIALSPSDDIWHDTLDSGIFVVFAVPAVIFEVSIYRSCVYFLTDKNKTSVKTALNVAACIISVLVPVEICILMLDFSKAMEIIIMASLVLLVALRLCCRFVGDRSSAAKEQDK